MAKSETDRKQRYLQLCEDSGSSSSSGHDSSISAALVSWNAREVLLSNGQTDNQHALLGYLPMTDGQKEPVLINTEHPWSAFICGSQGSGKSYTTSCVLEGCLSSSDQIGTLKQPMAGMVFRYDRYGTGICEAATLCTGRAAVKVKVLLSPFNFANVKPKYENIKKGSNDGMLQIQTFYIQSSHLNAERIHKFMASNDGSKPLYMSAVDRVLRDMGLQNSGPKTAHKRAFSYQEFRKRLEEEAFSEAQWEPLRIRLSILESYMEKKDEGTIMAGDFKKGYITNSQHNKQRKAKNATPNLVDDNMVEDTLTGEAGCLKVIDLTDPNLDTAGACALFDLALAVFIGSTKAPKVIALDEAHNYLGEGVGSAEFTEDLLKVIREQRHNGSRIVIATQEPTISTKFLDLCTFTIVHRFTSPDWFRKLRGHLGGASAEAGVDENEVKEIFQQIGKLRVGESLLFSPTALLDVDDEEVKSLNFGRKMLKTRKRISDDAGKSKLAQDTA